MMPFDQEFEEFLMKLVSDGGESGGDGGEHNGKYGIQEIPQLSHQTFTGALE